MPSPKDKFIASGHRAAMEQIAQTPAFDSACDFALLQLHHQLPDATDVSKGWDAHSQMTGGRKALEILKNLHKANQERKPAAQPRLNPQAGV